MEIKDRRVLITGGLGFLGSNLALKLVNQGAKVTIIDNLNPVYGGNKFNIKPITDKIKLVIGDIRDSVVMEQLIKEQDVIFLFAAQVSYIDSLSIPMEDLEMNAISTLTILEFCRKFNPGVKLVFSSSRMVLGKIQTPRYNEDAPTNPLTLYAIHKLTSEKYLLMYYKDFGIRSTIFRITNPYGPRQQIKHSKYSLPGWFVRCAMEDKVISIFGEGNQVRDYVFADDIIDAMISCLRNEETDGEIINIGSGCSCSFRDMVQTIVRTVGKGKIVHVPWPDNYERVETGDSIADISKLKRLTGFSPRINLSDGIRLTFEYYKKEWDNYVN